MKRRSRVAGTSSHTEISLPECNKSDATGAAKDEILEDSTHDEHTSPADNTTTKNTSKKKKKETSESEECPRPVKTSSKNACKGSDPLQPPPG